MRVKDTWAAEELMATIKKSHSKERQKHVNQEERITAKESLSRESRSHTKSSKRDSNKLDLGKKIKMAEKEKQHSPLTDMKLRDKNSKKKREVAEDDKKLKTSRKSEKRSETHTEEYSSQKKSHMKVEKRKSDESSGNKGSKTKIMTSGNKEPKLKKETHKNINWQSTTARTSPSRHNVASDKSHVTVKRIAEAEILPEPKTEKNDFKEAEDDDAEEVHYSDDFEDYESDFEEDLDDDDVQNESKKTDIAISDDHDKNSMQLNSEHLNKRNDSLDNNSNNHEEKLQGIATDSSKTISTDAQGIVPKETAVHPDAPTPQSNIDTADSASSQPTISERSSCSVNSLQEAAKRGSPATYQLYINFSVAEQHMRTQKVIDKIKKRGETLLDLINLDETSISIFSMAPTAYDEFMLTFGNTNTKQACIQTGDDNVPEESQTDNIEMLDLWTQYPPHLSGAVGGDFISKSRKPVEVARVKDWKYLSKFISESSEVMCCLLEDNAELHLPSGTHSSTNENIIFSDRVISLEPPDFRKGCCVTNIACCKLQPHIVLVIYETPTQDDDCNIKNKAIICEWNVYQPARPQKILISASQPLCCCIDAHANFVFAGMEDGSIALWYLREPNSWHRTKTYGNTSWVLRAPTYSTAEVLGDEGHYSQVIAISCQEDGESNDLTYKAFGKENLKGIIQLLTLEEQACLSIWVVTELSRSETTLPNTNLGLSPQGHIQLTKSRTINLQVVPSLHLHLQIFPRVLDFAINPKDASTFYVATDMGVIVSGSVYDDGRYKVFCHSQDGGAPEATSLCFLPIGESDYFLAGFSDGSMHLYKTSKMKPLMIFSACDNDKTVIKIRWSTSSPNLFYVLTSEKTIYLWDLKQSAVKPIISFGDEKKRITCFDVGSDKRYLNPSMNNYQPHMVLGQDDGTVEVHYLSPKYSRYGKEELDSFNDFVNLL